MADCPVCGMDVDESDPPVQLTYEGTMYYLCGRECAGDFDENPQQYT